MIRSQTWQTLTIAIALVGSPGAAQDDSVIGSESGSPAEHELSPAQLRTQAWLALEEGDGKAAIASADALLRLKPSDSGIARVAGDIYLRSGQVESATEQFNRFVQAHPQQMPQLWQRGISLYFTEDYEDAARQFEDHRKVNPHDVENAAWHFLCVAKAKSLEEARRVVLPAPGDRRIPMKEVLEMLSSGDTEAVARRVGEIPIGTTARRSADFYGDFYLGLYADALGDEQKARMYLRRSAKDAPRNYMGDVARVYAKYLESKQAKRVKARG